MKWFTFILPFLFWVSCSTLKKYDIEQINLSEQDQRLFDLHLTQLENRQFYRAAQGFEKLAKQVGSGPKKWTILFNAASAFLQIRHCSKAKEHLLSILDMNTPDSFTAPARLQMGYVYECLGQIKKAITSLQQIETSHISEQARRIELPGRLAILYRYLGKKKESLHQEELALSGIQLIKSSMKVKKIMEEEAAKSLYIMGRSLIHTKHIHLKTFLQALPYHQLYLSQSILISSKRWSALSKQELSKLYEKVWVVYRKQSTAKQSLYKKEIRNGLKELNKIAKAGGRKSLRSLAQAITKKMEKRIQ